MGHAPPLSENCSRLQRIETQKHPKGRVAGGKDGGEAKPCCGEGELREPEARRARRSHLKRRRSPEARKRRTRSRGLPTSDTIADHADPTRNSILLDCERSWTQS